MQACIAFSSLSLCLSVSVCTCVWVAEGVGRGWLNAPLLVIAFQHLRGESEICSKRSTFNRRQSASSELCNHHIIHYKLSVCFLSAFSDGEWGFIFTACPFWMFPHHWNKLKQQSERACERPSVTNSQTEPVVPLKERHPLSFCVFICVCWGVLVVIHVFVSPAPEHADRWTQPVFVCVNLCSSKTLPSIWTPLSIHYALNQRFTVYANPTHLPCLTHSLTFPRK